MDGWKVRGFARVSILGLVLVSVPAPAASEEAPTAEEATAFVTAVEAQLLDLVVELGRAQWVQSTYITEDTEILAAQAYERVIAAAMKAAREATRFAGLEVPEETARKLDRLRVGLTLPAPTDAELRSELTRIAAGLESAYGRGKYCPVDGECRDLGQLSRTMAESRDPDELLDAWVGWRTIAPPMRSSYARFVELGNQGARELGFADLGALWRSQYDMDPDAFRAELDRLWKQVRPLYEALHCHVRAELGRFYGPEVVPPAGPIPAHLLGNMWAQSWLNVYDLVGPGESDPGFDLGELLEARQVDAREMVRFGERFFTSLGLEPLPATFWERSLFTKPADRDVVCHASAWDVDQVEDLRIKMCIETTAEDFSTIHHELGHNYYQWAYSTQPFLFRESANDGFYEALGDTVALSVTPEYLVRIGLLAEAPDETTDLGVLMKMALDKLAFVPFGLLVDQWRWQVFAGEVASGDYNRAWWELRRSHQGVAPPAQRDETVFDPGAKYHTPANTPYARYFLAHILQFQMHRALCAAAGYEGPLHRCSVYGNAIVGDRLQAMMAMGASRPWPEALAALTGQSEMDATAILEYFEPLAEWLEARNVGRQCGW